MDDCTTSLSHSKYCGRPSIMAVTATTWTRNVKRRRSVAGDNHQRLASITPQQRPRPLTRHCPPRHDWSNSWFSVFGLFWIQYDAEFHVDSVICAAMRATWVGGTIQRQRRDDWTTLFNSWANEHVVVDYEYMYNETWLSLNIHAYRCQLTPRTSVWSTWFIARLSRKLQLLHTANL